LTSIHSSGAFQKGAYGERNLFFGIREHAMAAALNGITLHGGLRAFGGTFLVFSDYCRPSVRLAALMECPSIFVFSHDSIGLGEDGPTHQPIEHVMSLRTIPNLNVMRPADGNETSACWKIALESKSTPSVIVLTRQAVPVTTPSDIAKHPASRGGYVLEEAMGGVPKAIIVATGSEVGVALGAKSLLEADGIPTRVVNLVSWLLFEQQPESYREEALPRALPTVSVEAGTTLGWARYAQANVGIDRFGASAPGGFLMKHFGFTAENVAAKVRERLS
jgi:transketolase